MKKILKSLVMVTLFAIVLTAFTGCEAQDIIDMLTKMVTGVCQHEIVTDPEVPATCTEKGLTEGYHCGKCDEVFLERFETKALGHKVGEDGKPATCTDPAVCGTCEESFGEALGHTWTDATCAAPKTCKTCKATDGDPTTEHDWADATCAAPKTCKVCELTEGDPNPENHTYVDGTCVTPAKCQDCDAVGEPDPMVHDFGDDDVCVDCHVVLVTVYFYNADAWEAVHLYSWINGADGADKYTGEWPGAPMQQLTETWFGVQFLVPSTNGLMIIFNNGAGAQTGDLTFDPANIFWANGQAYASQAAAEAAVAGSGE